VSVKGQHEEGQLPEDFRRIRPPLEGRLIRLRAVEEGDVGPIHDMFNDPEMLANLGSVTFPESRAGTREWWEHSRAAEDSQTFAIETLAGELVGACSLEHISPRTRSAILGIWIGKPYWDQGYGTDAVRTLCRFGFGEMNLQRVELVVLETNPRGRRAYEKVGFKEEGRQRRTHFVGGKPVDDILMGLLAEELIED
jgi:RimJ/RimL family protein N-acetyltransferase